jgi:hypothetical protein
MANLPNTVFRNIQVEETAGTSSFSESLLQGIGGDLNYLKNQADTLQTQINNYYATGAVSFSGIFFGAGQFTVNSPNGKAWIFVALNYEFNGNVQNHWKPIIPGFYTYFSPSTVPSTTTSAPKVYMSGPTITVFNWGHEWSGYGLYYT